MLTQRTFTTIFGDTPLKDALDRERSWMSPISAEGNVWRQLIEVVLTADVPALDSRHLPRPRPRAFLIVVSGDSARPEVCEVRVLEGAHPIPWPPVGATALIHHEEISVEGMASIDVLAVAVDRVAHKILTRR